MNENSLGEETVDDTASEEKKGRRAPRLTYKNHLIQEIERFLSERVPPVQPVPPRCLNDMSLVAIVEFKEWLERSV